MLVKEISSKELKAWLDSKQDCLLVDVREPWEFKICHLPKSMNIPLGRLPNDFQHPFNDPEIITICHHGVRSQKAAFLLQQEGYKKVTSLQGGIDSWAKYVDCEMERY